MTISLVTDYKHGISAIDAQFHRPKRAAIHLLVEDGKAALIDTGTNSSIPGVLEALQQKNIAMEDVAYVILTHIHLDHAGAAGLIARENPAVTVHVHPFGAPHLIDPTKLINSATRIYGDQMEPLWGEFAPIHPDQVVAFADEQIMRVAGRNMQVFFTPGHEIGRAHV